MRPGAGKVLHHVAGFNPPDQWDEFQLQVFDDPWYRRTEWYPWVKKEPMPAGYPYNGIQNFPGEFDWGVLPKNEAEYGDMRAVDWAGKFLNEEHAKPFFAAVGLWHPHIPMFAPQRLLRHVSERQSESARDAGRRSGGCAAAGREIRRGPPR